MPSGQPDAMSRDGTSKNAIGSPMAISIRVKKATKPMMGYTTIMHLP